MQHCQRAGASNRTADELGEVFCHDTIDLVFANASPDSAPRLKARALRDELAALVWDETGYCRWLNEEPANQPEALQSMIQDAEGLLGDIGLGVEWDDGYVIHDASDWDEDGNLIGDDNA